MLLTLGFYQLVTHDTATAASAVEDAVDVATLLAGEACSRQFVSAARTEPCMIHEGPPGTFKVYPDAWPITAVTVPSGSRVAISERAIFVPSPAYDMLVEPVYGDGWTSVSYTGGYTEATCPANLKVLFAQLGNALLVNGLQTLEGVPAGATSVSLGDASITFGTGSPDYAAATCEALLPGAAGRLRGWRKRT